MKDNNIYYAARMAAAKKNRIFASRDRAAEHLHVSTEALHDYENGITAPPCDVVRWMALAYGQPRLKGQHMRSCCPLMTEGVAECSELTRAALSWITALSSADDVAHSFACLAVDGRIAPSEVATAQVIRQKAVELSRVMQETITAIDTALCDGQGGSHGY